MKGGDLILKELEPEIFGAKKGGEKIMTACNK